MADWNRIGRALRSNACRRAAGLLILSVAGLTFPASAAIVETFSVSNSYGFWPNTSAANAQQTPGGDSERFIVSSVLDGNPSELGVIYTATADDNGFFFLHQNYCVGTCSTFSQSVVTITLENTGPDPVSLRFDTQITPGHLSINGPSGGTDGQFAFSVGQAFGGEPTTLYTAVGSVIQDGLLLDTGGLSYTGQLTTNPAMSNWAVTDWGATNLSVDLMTINPGAISQLYYTATYYVRNDGTCDTLDSCSSLEVVFGDPRNKGGVAGRGTNFALAQTVSEPVVGGAYAPYFVPVEFVPQGSPPSDFIETKTDVDYTPVFTTNVPEPATWLTMLLGLGAIGGAARRSRRSLRPQIYSAFPYT